MIKNIEKIFKLFFSFSFVSVAQGLERGSHEAKTHRVLVFSTSVELEKGRGRELNSPQRHTKRT